MMLISHKELGCLPSLKQRLGAPTVPFKILQFHTTEIRNKKQGQSVHKQLANDRKKERTRRSFSENKTNVRFIRSSIQSSISE